METVDERLTYEERIAALSVGGAALDLTEPRLLKLTVDDLVLLDRHWQDDDHKSTELIDGRIYFTPARYMPRGWITQDLWLKLRETVAATAPSLYVGMRGSIKISPYDLPLPDIVVTSASDGEGFIPASSVRLVVEVADGEIDFCLRDKMRLYARGGIAEYWIVDAKADVLHQMWSPAAIGYGKPQETSFSERLWSMTIPDIVIDPPLQSVVR